MSGIYDDECNDWVIVKDPIKHREIATQIALEYRKVQTEQEGVFVIDTLLDTGLSHDLWVCDFCNEQIPVKDNEGNNLSITIWNNSRALCERCLTKWKSQVSTDDDETYDCKCGCSGKESNGK